MEWTGLWWCPLVDDNCCLHSARNLRTVDEYSILYLKTKLLVNVGKSKMVFKRKMVKAIQAWREGMTSKRVVKGTSVIGTPARVMKWEKEVHGK